MPFELPDWKEWIFFSSANGVRFFLEEHPVPQTVKIGAIGEATAKKLQKLGNRVDFIGTGNPEKVAKQFKDTAQGAPVLFPGAKHSLKSIQQAFPASQVVNLPVYATIELPPATMPEADLLLLTSPSNVRSLSKVTNWPPKAKVVAIGPSTAKALRSLGISAPSTSWEASEQALADALWISEF